MYVQLLCEESVGGGGGGGAQIHEVTDVGELELGEEVEVSDEGQVDDPPPMTQDPIRPSNSAQPHTSVRYGGLVLWKKSVNNFQILYMHF